MNKIIGGNILPFWREPAGESAWFWDISILNSQDNKAHHVFGKKCPLKYTWRMLAIPCVLLLVGCKVLLDTDREKFVVSISKAEGLLS